MFGNHARTLALGLIPTLAFAHVACSLLLDDVRPGDVVGAAFFVDSDAASDVTARIATARAELVADDFAAAWEELVVVRASLQARLDGDPRIRAKVGLWEAQEQLEADGIAADLGAIYAALDELAGDSAALAAKGRLERARDHAERGEIGAALEQLIAADEALGFTDAERPLLETYSLVHAALVSIAYLYC